MTPRRARTLLLAALAAAALAPAPARRTPGLERGVTLLPNGWRIAPAGRHLSVGDLPLAMVESHDGRYLVVTNDGYAKPTLTVVDLEDFTVRSRVPIENAWLGLAWNPAGDRLYSSGAPGNAIAELQFRDGALKESRRIELVAAAEGAAPSTPAPDRRDFLGGLAVSPDGARLYAVDVLGQRLWAVDLASGRAIASAALDAEPYTCLASPDGRTVFVSLWGGARVLVFDAATLAPTGAIAVGEHPNAMELDREGRRLYVACANTNGVWAVDVAARRTTETVSIALFPDAPPGATPNALALSPDGRRLAVANADNNAVAVVDVAQTGESRVAGFVPTGWYPTAVRFSTRREAALHPLGQGPRFRRESARAAAGRASGGAGAVRRRNADGCTLGRPDPGRACARAAHAPGVRADAAVRDGERRERRGATRHGTLGDSAKAGRRLSDPARLLRHPRESDVRPDPGRRAGRERRREPLSLSARRSTPNAHALAREFVAARQLLRQR